ncbi:hypothetical protein B0H11DRAFT_2245118 [Mycena galericulata]|nr:hypothetical protein B0H11DRAFT_2247894 [Mycena galericulata]KAJ7453996.1 hypothetical protein B0H11DRAFT_2245118 [Mycena galericulata]
MYNSAVRPGSTPAAPPSPIDYSSLFPDVLTPGPPEVSSDPPYYPRDWQAQRRAIEFPTYTSLDPGTPEEDHLTRVGYSSAHLPAWKRADEEDDIAKWRRTLGPWESDALRDRHTPQSTWPETVEGNAARHDFRRKLIRTRLAEFKAYCPELNDGEALLIAQFEINRFFPPRPQDPQWRPPRPANLDGDDLDSDGAHPDITEYRPMRDPLFDTDS